MVWAAVTRAWPIPLSEVSAHRIGGVLMVSGVALVFAAVWEFRSLARMSGRRTDRLVTSGPYRYSRNPQSVGWFLGLLGVAIYGRSSTALLFSVLLAAAFRAYLPVEERHLERVYGSEWRRYRQQTPRFAGLRRDGSD